LNSRTFVNLTKLMPEIETTRLHLRSFIPNDLDTLARLFADGEVMRHLGIESGKTLTRAEAQTVLDKYIAGWAEDGFGICAVWHKATQQLIGLCGLRLRQTPPELLYVLSKEWWGQGLAVEAARACLGYSFEALKLERIVALTRPDNVGSRRVLEKLGMGNEQAVMVYGVAAVSYELTRAEFQPSAADDLRERD
jgi:RimJ/RimL family protein N-acetyltransferase